MEVTIEEIDLNKLVQEVIMFLENESLHNRIQIKTNLEDGLASVLSDRTQLQQILLNIINNAMDAVVHDGIIEVSTKHQGDMAQISIEDNGPGMAPIILEHIFEPFFTTKEPGKGTGLGLSITYGLIKKLGGTVSVNSTVGKGTIFVICIPFIQPKNEEN
jgi:two-component system, NtrC family, sensor kinase